MCKEKKNERDSFIPEENCWKADSVHSGKHQCQITGMFFAWMTDLGSAILLSWIVEKSSLIFCLKYRWICVAAMHYFHAKNHVKL